VITLFIALWTFPPSDACTHHGVESRVEQRYVGNLGTEVTAKLEFEVKAETRNKDRASVAVVAGVIDVLEIEPGVETAPEVGVVIGFEDSFAPVVQVAVAEKELESAMLQVELVVGGDSVRNEDDARLVVSPPPQGAIQTDAGLDGLVDFRVRIGFSFAIVPAEASESFYVSGKELLKVEVESILTQPAMPASAR
jgi:hypothetical protein